MLALSLAGCGGSPASSGYDDFLEYQRRYAAERELVALLREYDAVYQPDVAFVGEPYTVEFVLENSGAVVLTDERFLSASYSASSDGAYSVTVVLDAIGKELFATATAENIGSTMSIVICQGAYRSPVSSPYINSAITDGIVVINGSFSEAEAKSLCLQFAAPIMRQRLPEIAKRYNELREKQRDAVAYLPASLSAAPPYTDVSGYIEAAEAAGF